MPKIRTVEKKAYDYEDASIYLSVSKDFLRGLADNKTIDSYKLGDLVRFKKEDLDDYLDKCRRK